MSQEINISNFAAKTYRIIDGKANSNSLIQGIIGLGGFPYTLLTDGAVVFTHYSPMLNEIRALMNLGPITKEMFKPIFLSVSDEILSDILFGKVLAQIPLIGVYFNALCAKTMTWRLGMLYSALTLHGEDIGDEKTKKFARRIRETFPQKDVKKFIEPDYDKFQQLLIELQK